MIFLDDLHNDSTIFANDSNENWQNDPDHFFSEWSTELQKRLDYTIQSMIALIGHYSRVASLPPNKSQSEQYKRAPSIKHKNMKNSERKTRKLVENFR